MRGLEQTGTNEVQFVAEMNMFVAYGYSWSALSSSLFYGYVIHILRKSIVYEHFKMKVKSTEHTGNAIYTTKSRPDITKPRLRNNMNENYSVIKRHRRLT